MNEKILQMIKEITEMGYKTITLNENQVSKIVGVSSSTLSNWREQGIGPQFRKMETTGKRGRIIYTKQSVSEWLCNLQKTA